MILELPISENYVSTWTHKEAIRELAQNAIDEGSFTHSYSDDENCLEICNYLEQPLPVSCLVLGETNKQDDLSKIGKFGEGLKLSMLVLLRQGFKIQIINHNTKWTPSLTMSDRFGVKTLHVEIEECEPINRFKCVVYGITPEMFEELKTYILQLELKVIPSSFVSDSGTILFDEKYSGNIYVNGLFIRKINSFKYGYDFKPEYLSLSRDRDFVSELDCQLTIKRFWSNFVIQNKDSDQAMKLFFELMNGKHRELEYMSYDRDKIDSVFVDYFRKEFPDKLPYKDEATKQYITYMQARKGTVVEESNLMLISSRLYDFLSEEFYKFNVLKAQTFCGGSSTEHNPYKVLHNYYFQYILMNKHLTENDRESFLHILSKSETWVNVVDRHDCDDCENKGL